MGKETAKVLSAIPAFEGREELIVNKQTTNSIIHEVLDAHVHFSTDYDHLVAGYPFKKSVPLEDQLFSFLKNNLHYNAEPSSYQSTRSPAGIIELGQIEDIGVDCKHYSGYIAGVLDAVNRANGERTYNWFYRFASYDINPSPGHVFVVVKNKDGSETWIDPVLSKINKRFPAPWFSSDKTIDTMSLTRLSGVDKRKIGCPGCGGSCGINGCIGAAQEITASEVQTQATGQQKIETVGTALEVAGAATAATVVGAVPGAIIAAVGAVVSEAGKLFGSNWVYNNEVRWLIQFYQYHVLGNGNVTSDNKVNQSLLQPALAWFFAVLGVPVYDRGSVNILADVDVNEKKQGYSATEAAARYLSYAPIAKLAVGVTIEEAVTASQIAQNEFIFWQDAAQTKPVPPGSWATLPVAQVWIDAAAAQGVASVDNTGAAIPASSNNIFQSLWNWAQNNPWLALLGLGAIGGGIYYLVKKSK